MDLIAQAAAKAAEIALGASTIGLEGVAQSGSYDPTEGNVDAIQGDTAGTFLDTGSQPVPHKSVPIAVPHVGDQYGPIGDERVILVPVQGGFVAFFHHGTDDSPKAPAGERWIGHRNPIANAALNGAGAIYDGWLKFTNDGPTLGDNLGGFTWQGGALWKLATTLGLEIVADETANTLTISLPGWPGAIFIDGNAQQISIGGAALDPDQNAVMIAADVQQSFLDFKAAMVAAGVPNAAAIVVPTVVGSTTVLAAD